MLVKLVLETTNAQKQNRSVMLLTGVGRNDKEEDQQQLQRERERKRGSNKGLWADLVLSGLLDALQDTKVLQRANAHTLHQAC